MSIEAAIDELQLPPVSLDERVIYFPVRHHSPACAWHVDRLISEWKPDTVLIEGPRDATPLIPFLTHEKTAMPVAIYATYVDRSGEGLPARHAAYYPMCDYSPELVAIRAAKEVGAKARFVDLTFAEKIRAAEEPNDVRADSFLQERFYSHSRLLQAACDRSGTRDPDDLWDHLYETDYENREPADFIRNVLAYCALARRDHTEAELKIDGTIAREQAMAAAVEETTGKVLIVTGGFHTVALPQTMGKMPKPVKVAPDDARVVLMRYGFEQLDSLNGYASGMPSPEFYQRQWEDEDPAELLVQIARTCRKHNMNVSTSEAIAALAHCKGLARLRGHRRLSREDLLDGVRSVYIKGAADQEGIPVLAIAQKFLAGERIGNVPEEAGLPPIVLDFRALAASSRIDIASVQHTELTLDIYRKVAHRTASRFMHRLAFLEVPFAEFMAGPDFVRGENLTRIRENWSYKWSPATESGLIERSLYGSTVEEAATGLLLEAFEEAEKSGAGQRSDTATQLLVAGCQMGLHRHTADLLQRTRALIAEDSEFTSLVTAMNQLLVLQVSREPLEAHHLVGLDDMALTAYERACYILPALGTVSPEQENETLDSLNALNQAIHTLGDTDHTQAMRWEKLTELAYHDDANPTIRGGASGLLYGDGQLTGEQIAESLRGQLSSARSNGEDGPNFLRGLLRTARSVLWQVPEVISTLHEELDQWEEERFLQLLPLLRLAMADLTPRECDRVAKSVAVHTGLETLNLPLQSRASEEDVLAAAKINHLVNQALKEDGLEWFASSESQPPPDESSS